MTTILYCARRGTISFQDIEGLQNLEASDLELFQRSTDDESHSAGSPVILHVLKKDGVFQIFVF